TSPRLAPLPIFSSSYSAGTEPQTPVSPLRAPSPAVRSPPVVHQPSTLAASRPVGMSVQRGLPVPLDLAAGLFGPGMRNTAGHRALSRRGIGSDIFSHNSERPLHGAGRQFANLRLGGAEAH